MKIDWRSLVLAVGAVFGLIGGFILYLFFLVNFPEVTLIFVGAVCLAVLIHFFYKAIKYSRKG